MDREDQILNDPELGAYTDPERRWIYGEFKDGVEWADSHPKEGTSIIEWKTGVPIEDGKYLVTLDDGSVATVSFNLDCDGDDEFFLICVLGWCKMEEIKPYNKV